ncbi:hypothetical protein KR084_004000 [Drosophila pseudotakahashii]|nr:hypothetical protein KR084_004000 [Drosophila pseudotakahashii]
MRTSIQLSLRLVALLVCLISCQASLEREISEGNNMANHKLSDVMQWRYEKRPFCNAFTGCGRKRTLTSNTPRTILKRNEVEEKPYNNEYLSEGLSDLIDINAEPAVENVQKQIMSQAKIYEAIKEASKEIFRQKNKQKMLQNEREMLQQLEERENK